MSQELIDRLREESDADDAEQWARTLDEWRAIEEECRLVPAVADSAYDEYREPCEGCPLWEARQEGIMVAAETLWEQRPLVRG